MLNKETTNNNISIGNNSNGNTVNQGNTFNGDVNVNYNMLSPAMFVNSFAKSKNYSALQTMAAECFSIFSQTHPLYPYYIAKFDSELQRLVSSPANDEALKKYPRSIKGNAHVDRSQCIGIDDSETPLDFAYRTQTVLHVDVDSMDEYLGDEKDPFPREERKEIFNAMIKPPEFPEAVEARLEAGDISIPFMFRRVPCMEFGVIVFGNTSFDHGFDIKLTVFQDNKHNLSITKTFETNLKNQLLREKLFINIKQSRQVKLVINDDTGIIFPYSEEQLDNLIFENAPVWIDYIQKLILIEEKTGCTFDRTLKTASHSTIRTAYILANSLNNIWTKEELGFDNEIRCNYDKIGVNVLNSKPDDFETLNSEMEVLKIELQGVKFSAKKCLISYENAKINNISSVRKAVKEHRNNILITIKPEKGYDKFIKKTIFTDIRVIE